MIAHSHVLMPEGQSKLKPPDLPSKYDCRLQIPLPVQTCVELMVAFLILSHAEPVRLPLGTWFGSSHVTFLYVYQNKVYVAKPFDCESTWSVMPFLCPGSAKWNVLWSPEPSCNNLQLGNVTHQFIGQSTQPIQLLLQCLDASAFLFLGLWPNINTKVHILTVSPTTGVTWLACDVQTVVSETPLNLQYVAVKAGCQASSRSHWCIAKGISESKMKGLGSK